jgi:acyl phosphate:glycerol-3-phosphate acyltransferase
MSGVLFSLSLAPFYLLGAFPTGRLVARSYGVEIEQHGSGNVGATNVARVIGKKAGITTLVGDVAKGVIGTVLARACYDDPWGAPLAGVALVAGHCFSIPGMKGGKGVATALGTLLGLVPVYALVALIVFAGALKLGGMVSLASVTSSLLLPIYAIITGERGEIVAALSAIALIIVLRHRQNLERIIAGTEPKFGAVKQ